MYKSTIFPRLLVIAIVVLTMISLVACVGSGTPAESTTESVESTTTGSGTDSTVTKEPVKLRILVNETGLPWNSYPDNEIAKEIEKQTGVTFEFVEADDNKISVLLAGGDLPDILRIDRTKVGQQLISGNQIIALDDLLKTNGQDILKNASVMLDTSKKYWSEGQGKVYFLDPEIAADPSYGFTISVGVVVRWDYYKEIGTPEIKNTDDLLNVIAAMVAKHPESSDGKKVYGVSFWNDWGFGWPEIFYNLWQTGDYAGPGKFMKNKMESTDITNILVSEDSCWNTNLDFLYKANKMGLLDPDAFLNKYDDFKAKVMAGQIVYSGATFPTDDFNGEYNKDGKGFVALPVGKYAFTGGVTPTGWAAKEYAISANCSKPERAMDLLNYIYSYDGARTLWSGIEGKHWNIVDGKPKLTDEVLELFQAGGDNWKKTGIQLEQNFIGLYGNTINPEDGLPLNLFDTDDMRSSQMNPLLKDFADHYGVKYPGRIFANKIEDGTMIGGYGLAKSVEEAALNASIGNAVATPPEDILKIEGDLEKLALKYTAKIALSKSDAEFEANKKEALDEFKAAGIDTYTEWYMKAWSDAKAKVGAK